jgi:DNA repair photolyase
MIPGRPDRSRPPPPKGRGATLNPANRFERIEIAWDPEAAAVEETPTPRTDFLRDTSRSIVARNESPDVGFEVSVNPYRGCEHGCAYCYARPYHEYLGLSAGLDFETRILVKENAPALLRKELLSPRWKPQTLALSGVTDPYQPVERRLRITRGCLEVLCEFRNPVIIVTKNRLVTRDVDLLGELAKHDAAGVFVSITTLDHDLARVLEPRTSSPRRRLETIETLGRAGIPVGAFVAPVIPGLTEHETPAIVAEAARAGARFAGSVLLRLPHGVADIFDGWLDAHRPGRKEKVLARIRDAREGRLTDTQFGKRMRGRGPYAEQLRDLFEVACRREGLRRGGPKLSADSFRRPTARTEPQEGSQLGLFDGPGRTGAGT